MASIFDKEIVFASSNPKDSKMISINTLDYLNYKEGKVAEYELAQKYFKDELNASTDLKTTNGLKV